MKIIKLFYILLLVISVFTLVVGTGFSFPVHAAETTYYLGSTERTFNDNGTLVSEKVYIGAGNATVLKQCNNGAMKQCASPTTSYLYADHLGSTVLITDDKGTKETSLQYYPYGNETVTSQQGISDKLYTGQRKDYSSDLYFYNARYYNPTTGNFISADKAEGPNRYAYVGNNPIMRNDPSGMKIYDMDKTKKWSKVSINTDDNRYAKLVEASKLYFQNNKNDPEKANWSAGQNAIFSAFHAMDDYGYANYTFDKIQAANTYLDNVNKQIVETQNKIKNSKKILSKFGEDKIDEEYLGLNKTLSELNSQKSNIQSQIKDYQKEIPPEELLDYMKSYENQCREQSYLAQYLLKEMGVDTKYAFGNSMPSAAKHYFLVWNNPEDNIDYQLDVMYVWNEAKVNGYYQPLSKYMEKNLFPYEGYIFTYLNQGLE